MNDAQDAIAGLPAKGRPLAAVAEDLGAFRTAFDKWVAGECYPRNAHGLRAMPRRLERRRTPKTKPVSLARARSMDRPAAQPAAQVRPKALDRPAPQPPPASEATPAGRPALRPAHRSEPDQPAERVDPVFSALQRLLDEDSVALEAATPSKPSAHGAPASDDLPSIWHAIKNAYDVSDKAA